MKCLRVLSAIGVATIFVFSALTVLTIQPVAAKPGGTGLPNLLIDGITTDPAQPVGGQQTTIIYGIVSNTRVPISTEFYTDLLIDNEVVQSLSLPSLGGGMYHEFSYVCTLAAGSHTLKVFVDSKERISEVLETDNTMSKTITWQAPPLLPDVAATDISIDPVSPIGGMSAWIVYWITTNSVPFSTTIYTDLYVDDVWVNTQSLEGSSDPASHDFFYQVTLAGGNHDIKIITDSTNVLTESSETNNQWIETVNWQVGPPDLIVTDIWTDPVYPLGNKPVTIYYRVANIGTGPAIPNTPSDTFGTGLWITGVLVAAFNTGTLAPGESATGSYSTSLNVGTYTLLANTNFGRKSQVPGDDVDNNPRTETIRWHEDTADSDGDGLGNIVESNLGTDPNGCDKWAVIIVGGWGNVQGHQNWINYAFVNSASHIYLALTSAGFTRDHIYIISEWDLSLNHEYPYDVVVPDAPAAYTSAMNAIYSSTGWLRTHSDADDSVFIYMVDHGRDPDGHFLLNGFFQEVFITDEEMGTWVNAVSCYRLTFVIDSCFSGQFQDNLNDPHDNERIVISGTSATLEGMAENPDGLAPTGDEWTIFTKYFVSRLSGSSIEQAFYYAYYDVQNWAMNEGVIFQEPWGSDSEMGLDWYL